MNLSEMPAEKLLDEYLNMHTLADQACDESDTRTANTNSAALRAELLRRLQPEWISVEERLPDQVSKFDFNGKQWTSSCRVLAWAHIGYEHWDTVIATYSEQNGWHSDELTSTEVTRWRELPKPPIGT